MSSPLARDGARAILDAYDAYHDAFHVANRNAARHFAERAWLAVRRDTTERLLLYSHHVQRALGEIVARAGSASWGSALWGAMRDAYAADVEGRPDQEIAETFFSSASRRHLGTVGVEPVAEFLRPYSPAPPGDAAGTERRWCPGDTGVERLAAAILAGMPHALADPDAEVRRVGRALDEALRAAWGDDRADGAELLSGAFYRNKGAYLVGRLRRGDRTLPLALAFLNEGAGVTVDALLTSADDISRVFGFAWSYFHVEVPRAGATVAYLNELMPLKRVDELYTAIGYNKHGKTELYRRLVHELAQPEARFEDAEGVKGLVMAVFTLPSFNVVFKVIKDLIGAPKRTTREQVEAQYRRVFLRDRVGRLADAQLFEGLEFRRECFSDHLLADLLRVAPSVVRAHGDRVVLQSVYTERRVRPLNLYVRDVEPAAAEAAIRDYGEAIKDLAAANIFPGDLLLKNFGVSRHGRVIFYDYDELAALTEVRFRHLPEARSVDDELAAEPWFSVAEHDVFPEEFAPFLVPTGPLRDAFMATHGDLLDPDWWISVQERVAAGELVDTYPYPQERRIERDR